MRRESPRSRGNESPRNGAINTVPSGGYGWSPATIPRRDNDTFVGYASQRRTTRHGNGGRPPTSARGQDLWSNSPLPSVMTSKMLSLHHYNKTGDTMQKQSADIQGADEVIELDGWKIALRFSREPNRAAMKNVKDILINQRIALRKEPEICNFPQNVG